MESVTLTIDGVAVTVPKGANLIDAANAAGIEIPHYCYHPQLPVAGNCRMCQVQVEGQPKLTIACNTTAAEGMKVHTHRTSAEVAEAQRATLEFLLINHPLDCTVCDQAGHCKLQDYYSVYSRQPSRFVEEKERKVKAEVLGPEVIYDGERCILCTRCVRFCTEVTKTGELGVFDRGDRSYVGIHPGVELNNPLSGTVADLCPVGALTHRKWRFNTRIWFTKQQDSVCPGCSTGCSVKAATRDGKVVHVKARFNPSVNNEWLCDEGRYGFERFQPDSRLTGPAVKGAGMVSWDKALRAAAALRQAAPEETAFLISAFLTLEEIWLTLRLAKQVCRLEPGSGQIALAVRERMLTPQQAVLVSPDYAPNARSGELLGVVTDAGGNWRHSLEQGYERLLTQVRQGRIRYLVLAGDKAVLPADNDEPLRKALQSCELSVELTPSAGGLGQVQFPSRTINEKSGVLLNGRGRLQQLRALFDGPSGSYPEWVLLQRLGEACGVKLLNAAAVDEQSLFREMAGSVPQLGRVSLAEISGSGVLLEELQHRAAAL